MESHSLFRLSFFAPFLWLKWWKESFLQYCVDELCDTEGGKQISDENLTAAIIKLLLVYPHLSEDAPEERELILLGAKQECGEVMLWAVLVWALVLNCAQPK